MHVSKRWTMNLMNPRKNIRLVFHILLVNLTIILFILHVSGVIEKTMEKQTSFTTTQKYFKTLNPPCITLCPGHSCYIALILGTRSICLVGILGADTQLLETSLAGARMPLSICLKNHYLN